MPEAPNAVVPTSSAMAQQQKQPEAPAVAPAVPPENEWAAKYRKLESEHTKKVREQITERRKWESERKDSSAKLSRLGELEKTVAQAKLNPNAFLKNIYGDNWYDVVVESRLNGVPPAALIEQEVQKIRDDFDAKLKARDEESAKASQASQTQAADNARRTLFAEASSFWRDTGKEFPILEELGAPPAIARTLAARIEREFNNSTQWDESGNMVRQGRVLTMKEAAELVEGELLRIAEKATGTEKYKARLQPKPATGTVESAKPQQDPQKQGAGQQRRSISNELTGSTSPAKPALSQKEKRERAEAAYAEARRKSSDRG